LRLHAVSDFSETFRPRPTGEALMPDIVQTIFVAIGFLFLVGGSGAAFAFGVATVCRWLAWAPINIIVNVNDRRSADDGE
jgi:hypothetical protein